MGQNLSTINSSPLDTAFQLSVAVHTEAQRLGVYTETFQLWAKALKAGNVTRKYLIEIAQDKWNQYIFTIGPKEVETFVECVVSSTHHLKSFHVDGDISCGHETCQNVFYKLKSLLNKPSLLDEMTVRKSFIHENKILNVIDLENDDINKASMKLRLNYSFIVATLFHRDGNISGKTSFSECNMYEITEMMKGCKLFDADDTVLDFDEVCRIWRYTVCSPDNSMSERELTGNIKTMEDLFVILHRVDTHSHWMDAIDNLREIASMNFATEYQNTEYLVFAKSVLETKRLMVEDEFDFADELLQKTKELIQLLDECINEEEMRRSRLIIEMQENEIPGKPVAFCITAHSIQLYWDPAKTFGKNDYYQVSYRDSSNSGKWKYLTEEYANPRADVIDLLPDTKYIFRVRVVTQNGEKTSSQPSDEYKTKRCPAFKTVRTAQWISGGILFAKYQMQMRLSYENSAANIRSFEIGTPEFTDNEKTILLVGGNEAVKREFVNGILNYAKGVHWSDPFRFVATDVETQMLYYRNITQAQCETEWITSYIIYPEQNDLSRYQINVIDIPASSGTPNQNALDQLSRLFEGKCLKDFKQIHSLCVFDISESFHRTVDILSCFGKDLQNNVCAIITLDGQKLSILPALNEFNIPLCVFHNSSLFAKTAMINTAGEEKLIWEKDVKTFELFFSHLNETLPSNLTLTTFVIANRLELNQTISKIQSTVAEGENKLKQLHKGKRNLLRVMKTVEDNSNYTYEVDEEQHVKKYLKQGDNSTVCSICFYTCHPDCAIDSDNKAQCSSMENEYCTACPKKCHWTKHTRVSYVYEKVNVKVKKTNDDMFQKYTEASIKQHALESYLSNQIGEIKVIWQNIDAEMENVEQCVRQINKCAFIHKHFDAVSQIYEDLGLKAFIERVQSET